MVNWQEENKLTVTHLEDYEKSRRICQHNNTKRQFCFN